MRLVSDTMGKMTDCFRTRSFKSLGMLHGVERCRITDIWEELDAPFSWQIGLSTEKHLHALALVQHIMLEIISQLHYYLKYSAINQIWYYAEIANGWNKEVYGLVSCNVQKCGSQANFKLNMKLEKKGGEGISTYWMAFRKREDAGI